MPVTTVNSAGINWVKPSDRFIPKANAISKMPAMQSNTHAIARDPLVESGRVAARCAQAKFHRLLMKPQLIGPAGVGAASDRLEVLIVKVCRAGQAALAIPSVLLC